MDKQEIFDKVAVHLLAQGKPSLDEDGKCVYRAPDGCKCAIGCLIPDEKYRQVMEFKTVYSSVIMDACGFNYDYGFFLMGLQRIHDEYDPIDWQGELRELAKQHDLSTAAIDNMRQS